MRNKYRLRSETGWAEFGYFLCYFKEVAPSLSFYDRWSRGAKTLGARLKILQTEMDQFINLTELNVHQENKSFTHSIHMLRSLMSMFSNEFDYEPTLITKPLLTLDAR